MVVTPTLKAAQIARTETGAPAGSTASLVFAHGWRWDEHGTWTRLAVGEVDPVTGRVYTAPQEKARLRPGDLLIVDEAGMLDQDTAGALLTVADECQARLALLGDRHQLAAVGRGGVLDLAAVLPRWAGVPLIRVTHGEVQAWLTELSSRGLSGASVRKAQGVLAGVLGLAVRDRRLAVNPALGVALPAMGEKRRRYLTAEQLEALAEAAGPGRVAVLVLGYCGLRRSELAALRVRHFDLLRRRLLVEEAVTEVDGARLVWAPPRHTADARCRCRGSSSTSWPGRW
jgi:hypothetical protein